MIEGVRRLGPAIALMALLAGCSNPSGGTSAKATPSEATLRIDSGWQDVEIQVEVADTLVERARGLMGRRELDEDAGMVFLTYWPTDTPFWMKDTLIPLSVAFWDEEGRIFRILDMEPCRGDPCPLYEPGGSWVGAVEVNQGFFAREGVEVGDRVRLER
jgi:uncharacterized membrane protein (UPF0127 family)